ncbi:hypothetical protein [Shinella zoogloeoides]|uniref:hypothetical protein n=1 Tax=Shinella zoogloeoides TaxID=352475 RepID=UPI0028AF087E|nr:hypothetical protein [Shinella zoogloeoides]
MIDNDDLSDRHTIPRWLSLQQSKKLGELGSNSGVEKPLHSAMIADAHRYLDEEFVRVKSKWISRNDIADAEELLSIALVADRMQDDAVLDAINLLLTSEFTSASVVDFAQRASSAFVSVESELPVSEAHIRLEIARRKKLFSMNPRDSLRLTETALLYASIGQTAASEGLLKRALILTPNDRYVLRASSRFFMHVGDQEKARSLLIKSAASKHDPWLKSALLAVEAAMGRSPTGWRRAKALLSDASFSERDLSELAVQMGTLEFIDGSRKQAIRLMRQGALSPTENAIAQIEWVGRRKKAFQREDVKVDVSLSHEASAYSAYERSDWEEALTQCEAWRQVEPFSVRAPIFGSFVASVSAASVERGIRLAQSGLVANPRNVTLLNNLAVLHALDGNIDNARRDFTRAEAMDRSPEDVVMLLATRGLIEFRAHKWDLGARLYGQAIDEASKQKHAAHALRAYCFMGREFSRIDGGMAVKFSSQIDEIIVSATRRGWSVPKDIAVLRAQIEEIGTRATLGWEGAMPSVDWEMLLNSPIA